jgi:hypothetical protein
MLPALTWNFRLGVRAIGKAAATPFTFHFSSPSSPRPAFHHLPPPLRSIAELKLDPPSPLTRSLGIGGCPWGACAFRSAPRPRLRGLPSRSSPTTSSAPSRGRRTPFTGLPTNEPTYEPTPRDSHSKFTTSLDPCPALPESLLFVPLPFFQILRVPVETRARLSCRAHMRRQTFQLRLDYQLGQDCNLAFGLRAIHFGARDIF